VAPARVSTAGRRALVGSGAAVAVAVALANGLNAVFQFALARVLHPAEYSLLASLVTIVLISQVPTLGLQASVARDIAARLADGDRAGAGGILRSTLRSALLWSGGILLLTAAAFGPLAAALGARRALPLVVTAATIALALGLPVAWAGLWGEGRFVGLSVAQIGFAASRLGAGLGVGLAGGGTSAVMAGVAAATAATFAASIVPVRALLAAGRHVVAGPRLATLANAGAAGALTIFTALTSIDLLVAKLAFAPHVAGAYAAGSVGARVLLLVPIGVTTVLFPRVATLRDAARERRYLLGGLGVVAAMCAVAVTVLFAFAGPLIDATFGSRYHAAAPWLGPLALAMALYALAMVYLFHFLSLGRSRSGLVLAALLAVQLVVFAIVHGRPADLIGVQIGMGAATLAACELWYLRTRRARRPRGPLQT
jgi:O-antigen/teichoic acid export membrane protein